LAGFPHTQDDVTSLRELDRVPEQISEQLACAAFVTDQINGQRGIKVIDEFEALLVSARAV
jgi:hypothetical protein